MKRLLWRPFSNWIVGFLSFELILFALTAIFYFSNSNEVVFHNSSDQNSSQPNFINTVDTNYLGITIVKEMPKNSYKPNPNNFQSIIYKDFPNVMEITQVTNKPVNAADTPKKVALTFDDGPDPTVTTQILATLEKYDAKATFFMLGSQVEYFPEIAKNVVNAGHEIGNHTWNHPDLTKTSVEKILAEMNKTSSIIESVTGQKTTLFRPPYGKINKTVLEQTTLPIIMWDVDTYDWKHRDPEQLLANVKRLTTDGSIILMHDIHQSTADGLDAVLAYLRGEGYTFVTVSEMNEQ